MKTAKAITLAVGISCPECGEPQAEPSTGSLLWAVEDVRVRWDVDGRLQCFDCGADYRLPKIKA